MNRKLEVILKKYQIKVDEVIPLINKLYKKKLCVPKTKNRTTMLLEDLRLYSIANDTEGALKTYYGYVLSEQEKKLLPRYDNTTTLNILTLQESKSMFFVQTGKSKKEEETSRKIHEKIN